MSSPEAIGQWFLEERGITPETLNAFGVGVRADGAVVIPYPKGNKIRRGLPHGERTFFFEGDLTLFRHPGRAVTNRVILVEGETDAMRLWQEWHVNGGTAGVVPRIYGLPGIETWNVPGTHDVRPVILEDLKDAESVHIVFDNDKDYMVQARVDAAWKAFRHALGRKAKRVRLPGDVKDVCDFFARYDMELFQELLNVGPGLSRYRPLDFTGDPPPVRWLVEGLLCRGDNHLLMGEPGIGKSWLDMSLAVAVLQGSSWLSRPVVGGPGRVLVADEENPEDLIFDRLFRLGMRAEDIPNLRYLNNENIRLDRDPSDFIDEAIEFDPALIVLDSLTRFHTGDEDKAGVMAALYNDALKPLARETGAAVLLLHHANKSDGNSSYRRSRGSGEIVANADAGFDLRLQGVNILTMAKFKSRRGQAGEVLNIQIKDNPETGLVEVIGGADLAPPF